MRLFEHLMAADWNAAAQEVVDKLFSELQTRFTLNSAHMLQSRCKQHQALIITATHQETIPEVVAGNSELRF